MNPPPFWKSEYRIKILEGHADLLNKYLVGWPTYINLEDRIDDLTSKDYGKVRCIGRRKFRSGYIYQFELYKQWPSPQADQPPTLNCGYFSLVGGHGPNTDGYWYTKGFFRGLDLSEIAFVEIPDPDVWLEESHSDRFTKPRPLSIRRRSTEACRNYNYTMIKVKGFLKDLEFATLVSKYDFVVSETDGFYHDMMAHIGNYIKKDDHKDSKASLVPYLEKYQNYSPKSELLEFIFGYSADVCVPISEFSKREFERISAEKKVSPDQIRSVLDHFIKSL